MTLHNIVVVAIAVSIVRLILWKYWTKPRRDELIRKIAREEIVMARRLQSQPTRTAGG